MSGGGWRTRGGDGGAHMLEPTARARISGSGCESFATSLSDRSRMLADAAMPPSLLLRLSLLLLTLAFAGSECSLRFPACPAVAREDPGTGSVVTTKTYSTRECHDIANSKRGPVALKTKIRARNEGIFSLTQFTNLEKLVSLDPFYPRRSLGYENRRTCISSSYFEMISRFLENSRNVQLRPPSAPSPEAPLLRHE